MTTNEFHYLEVTMHVWEARAVMRALALVSMLSLFVACGPSKVECTTMNCSGCCDQTTGDCRSGSDTDACGTGGKLCVACTSPQTCSENTCKAPIVTRCSASNCDGCCDSTGTCQSGKSTEACGRGGESCAPCASGKTCINNENVSGVCQ